MKTESASCPYVAMPERTIWGDAVGEWELECVEEPDGLREEYPYIEYNGSVY